MINREHPQHSNPTSQLDTDARSEHSLGFGITTPLLTTASGQKFGKSAGNAVWLDQEMTSVFDFYQFFLRTADADVERQLLLFTFLPVEDVKRVMLEHFVGGFLFTIRIYAEYIAGSTGVEKSANHPC